MQKYALLNTQIKNVQNLTRLLKTSSSFNVNYVLKVAVRIYFLCSIWIHEDSCRHSNSWKSISNVWN